VANRDVELETGNVKLEAMGHERETDWHTGLRRVCGRACATVEDGA
jgi:hypothetical protein